MTAFRHTLLGQASTHALAGDRTRTLRALEILASLHARAATVGRTPADREAAAREIEAAVSNLPTLDSQTLGLLGKGMADARDPFTMDSAAWSKGFGLGVKVGNIVIGTQAVARILGGTLSPGAAVALQLAGVLAEPTLIYLADHSTPGHDLSHGPIMTPADPPQLESLSRWAFEKSAELYDSDDNLRLFTSDPAVKTRLGIDLGAEPSALVTQLPAELQKAVSEAVRRGLSDVATDLEAQNAILTTLRASVNSQLDMLAQKTNTLQSLMRDELGERERARALARVEADIQFVTSEIAGARALGGALIGTVFGNEQAARIFQTAVGSVQQIYQAVGLYTINKLGTIALTGTFIGAASALMSVMGPNQDQQVLQAIQMIHKKLDQLQAQLDRIESSQQEILGSLRLLYAEMERNAAEARARLDTIETRLLKLIEDASVNQRAADETAHGANLDQVQSLLRRPMTDRETQSFRDQYIPRLTLFYSYATRVSKQPAFTGDESAEVTFAQARDLIVTRRTADLMFGLLPALAALVGVIVPTGEDLLPTGSTLPNPITWAQGVNAYLEARILASEVQDADDGTWLPLMWKDGIRLRDAARVAGSYRSVRSAVQTLRAVTGVDIAHKDLAASATVLGVVLRSYQTFTEENFTKRYVLIEREWGGPHDGERIYSTGDVRRFRSVRANVDPLDLAVQLGLLERRCTFLSASEDDDGRYEGYACQLIVKVGPEENKPLLGKVLYEHHFSGVRQGVFRCWNPIEPSGDGRNPIELLDACSDLLRAHSDLAKLRSNFPEFLQRELRAALLTTFEGAARIAQLFVTIALWRAAPQTIEPLTTRVTGVPGLVSVDDVAVAIKLLLQKDVEQGKWESFIVEATRAQFKADFAAYLDTVDRVAPEENILLLTSACIA